MDDRAYIQSPAFINTQSLAHVSVRNVSNHLLAEVDATTKMKVESLRRSGVAGMIEVIDLALNLKLRKVPGTETEEEPLRDSTVSLAVAQAIKAGPEKGPDIIAQAADKALARGRIDDAEQLGAELVKNAPTDSRGPSLLAQASLSDHRPADAERWAQKALELDPNNKAAKDALSYARSELSVSRLKKPVVGNFSEARTQDLAQGLSAGGLSPRPSGYEGVPAAGAKDADPTRRVLAGLLRRGYEKMNMGDLPGALEDVSVHLDSHPEDAGARLVRPEILLRLGKPGPALADIDAALAKSPDDPRALRARAAALYELGGRDVEALTTIEPVVEAALRRLGAAADIPREKTLGAGDLVAGQYRITRELGRGGMGVVFEAVDEKLKRAIALKQLQGDFRSSAEDAARFLQEARLVAQLRRPNVAEIYAAVEDGGLYLVFELVRGRRLDAVLGAGVTPEQARGIVAHACAALTAAHARRIVHRDLKPSNLMLSDAGEVKVMDFGIAHQSVHGGAFTQTSASGTPPYMAPEQAMGSVSSGSDLYALGVMAYELLAGVRPFDGPDFLGPKMRGEFASVTSRKAALPARLDAFFASALSPDPARRPRDAAAFASAFAACWS